MIILGLLESARVDFLLVLIELFSLGVTADALRAIICSKSAILLQRGPVDPKFQVDGVAPINHSFSQKTRLCDLSYGTLLCLTPPTDGFPWDDLCKIFTERSRMAKVPNGVESLPKISIA